MRKRKYSAEERKRNMKGKGFTAKEGGHAKRK